MRRSRSSTRSQATCSATRPPRVRTVGGSAPMTSPCRTASCCCDSASLYFRAFFGVPDQRSGPERAADQRGARPPRHDRLARRATHRPTHLVACWDNDWRPAFRVEADPDLQGPPGGRGQPTSMEESARGPRPAGAGHPSTRSRPSGIARLGADGYEADDVIGTLRPSARGRDAGRRRHRRPRPFQLVDDAARCGCSTPRKGGVRDPDLVDAGLPAREVRRRHRRAPTPTWRSCAATPATACRASRASARRPRPS